MDLFCIGTAILEEKICAEVYAVSEQLKIIDKTNKSTAAKLHHA